MTGTTAATGATPMPAEGRRSLTPAEAQARQRAMACLRQKSAECQGQIHVSIFFDGTGNNRDWNGVFVTKPPKTRSTQTQLQRNGQSNVARLYDASFDQAETGLFSIYIPGVGTPFPEVGDNNQEGSAAGGGAARYGADRIHWAIIEVINAVHVYLSGAPLIKLDQAKLLANEMSRTRLLEGALRRSLLGAIATRLENVVKTHQRKVRSLDITVFGFSRGAAQARAFVHRIFEVVQVWGSGCGHNIGGVPMTLRFMGGFDTVASVGIAGISRMADGKMDWARADMMSIHPEVRRSVHFAGLHEQRINFPLDLAATGKEVLYPGMHSDVGGGYSPGGQGKDYIAGGVDGTAKLAQIPLIDMHHEAIKAGVPMRTIEELQSLGDVAMHFGCHPQLIRDYNAWLTGHGLGGGARAEQIRRHCRQYVQWKGQRLWSGAGNLMSQPFFVRADEEDQHDLRRAQTAFGNLVSTYSGWKSEYLAYDMQLQTLREGVRQDRTAGRSTAYAYAPRSTPGAHSYALLNADTKELLDVVIERIPVADASATLFDNYVQDSLAGFYIMGGYTELNIPVLSTTGYLRYRTTFNLTSSIQSLECIDPLTSPVPPLNIPTMGQIFDAMPRM